MNLTVGSLCAGIGGIEYGLELTGGFTTRWQAEINPFARRVLAKHWPAAQQLKDVRHVSGDTVPPVDLITAGFPCQPFSHAGSRKGEQDERHLWPEVARVVRDLHPRWLLVENVPGLLTIDGGRTFGRILSDLAEIGYDAEWTCLRASDFGAAHERERIFLLAYPHGTGREEQYLSPLTGGQRQHPGADRGYGIDWRAESPVLRAADDVPRRVDRVKALGNAVVPMIACEIGHLILQAERAA